ncbi:hypothetical protein UFOVP374_43 [uncultured Caudovirales phage]|uniref:Uncharacterized protein n=1 Tax=uncultured Caudovirales phage TaxID=2100421 RepID=A0A6J7X3R1_9CAUD|nr:hypothetical protein UFOVP374_43 [uncultured Caudovirales phage]
MLTIEEQERAAYASGNTALAAALGRVIDLENRASDLRAVIRDAVDLIDQDKTDTHAVWHQRARAALEEQNYE